MYSFEYHKPVSQKDAEELLGTKPNPALLDLSRFDAAPLIAFIAAKETKYGTETDG